MPSSDEALASATSSTSVISTRTYPRGKCEFQIIGPEGVVVNGGIQCLIEEVLVPEQVLGDTQPETEKLQRINIPVGEPILIPDYIPE